MRLIAFVALFICLCSAASATSGFKCTVKAVGNLQDDGTHSHESVFTSIGDEFVVDRGTGRMVGRLTNHSIGGQPKVIDAGSAAQAFKVLTVFSPNVSINYLQINVYEGTYEKTFFFIEFNEYISGLCKPY